MSDARKRAEEALALGPKDVHRKWAIVGALHYFIEEMGEERIVRALLAEEPEAPDFIRCAVPRGECCHQRIPTVLPLEAPECNDGDDCCRYCGRGLQPCGACKPASLPPEVREAAAPSEDQVREFAYYLGGDRAVAAIEAVPAPASLPPEVREAAEVGRVVVTATRRVGDKDTMSFDGTTFTTVRACCDCGVLICGGPTRCLYCAAKLPTSAPGAECTGIAASWCPVHGNCSCPRDEEGARTENRFGVDCPLHGLASNHGDAEVSALAARRGA